MKQILSLFALLLVSLVGMAQAPSNYTNINGRYRWIAGMFDSTFHIPKGSTPSLRTGGSTNAGALFYRTSDSTVRYWTGSQWLTLSDTTRFVPYVGATKDVDLDTWSAYAKSFHVKGTGGQGHLGLKFQSATPNMSANESGVYADANGNLGVKIDNAYTSIFKTNLNSADRTYTFQNKSYTVADSADVAARITGTLISGYLTKATGTLTIDTSQIYQSSGLIGIGTASPTAKLTIVDSANTAVSITNRAFINDQIALNIKVNGNRGYAAIIQQNDSTANGTQYQTVFRKGMMPGTGNPAPGAGVGVVYAVGNDNNQYMNTGVFRSRAIDTTGYIGTGAKTTSIELWTRKNNVWDTTVVLSGGSVGIATGQNGIDSVLSVGGSTHLKSTVRMSGLPTGVGTKALRINASGTISVADTLTNGISGSGTTNYVTKFTSSTGIGNSQIFDNGTSVGINNASPSSVYKLDVTGTSRSNGGIALGVGTSSGSATGDLIITARSGGGISGFAFERTGTSAYAGIIASRNTMTSEKMWTFPDSTGTVALLSNITGAVSGTTNRVSKFTSANAIGNSSIVDSSASVAMTITTAGNVGIGTATPNAPLNVQGTSVMARFQSGTTSEGRLAMAYNTTDVGAISARSGSMAVYAELGNNLTLGVGSQDNIYVRNTGQVGIGTSTADSAFQVLNGAYFQRGVRMSGLPTAAGTKSVRIDATGKLSVSDTLANGISGTGTTNYIPKFTSANVIGDSRFLDDGTTTFLGNGSTNASPSTGILSGTGGSGTDIAGAEFRIRGGASTGTGAGGAITFYTAAAGGVSGSSANAATEKMRLTSAGNLGIGVTPSAWGSNHKAIQGFSNSQFGFVASINSVAIGTNYYHDNTNYIYATTGQNAARYDMTAAGVHRWFTAPSGTAGNAITFTQAMTLDASGRLGIGTTSPNTQLQVNGTPSSSYGNLTVFDDRSAAITQGGVIALGGYKTSTSAAALFAHIAGRKENSTAGNEAGYLAFLTNDNSSIAERMRITSGGNVGIGTTSPTQLLHLQGSGTTYLHIGNSTTGSTSSDGFDVGYFTGETILNITQRENDAMVFSTNNTEKMRLNAAGELLIGTTSDAGDYKLQVSGNVYATGSLGIGATNLTGRSVRVSKTITGSTSGQGIVQDGVVQSDVTSDYYGVNNTLSTAAASFTLANAYHYTAGQGTIGATSAVTSQYGFYVDASMTGATNNYGFYGAIASGSNRWNLYMGGTANNYLKGTLAINTTSPNASALLDISSTTQGFLPPRMTGAQAEAIATPAAGLMIYANSGNGTTITSTGWWGYDGSAWVKLN